MESIVELTPVKHSWWYINELSYDCFASVSIFECHNLVNILVHDYLLENNSKYINDSPH